MRIWRGKYDVHHMEAHGAHPRLVMSHHLEGPRISYWVMDYTARPMLGIVATPLTPPGRMVLGRVAREMRVNIQHLASQA